MSIDLAQIESPAADESLLCEQPDSLLRRHEGKNSGTIMVVDDEPINIKIVQKYLRGAGYESFVTTTDSREAVDMIRRERPDVIILDVMMPHITGLNILEVVRGDQAISQIPVLILTASVDDETRSHALDLGATDFLSKPVKPTELIPRVKNALVLKAHHDQMAAYSKHLEQEVRERTAELARSRQAVIHVLACAAEYRDEDTGNHVLRVGRFAGIIARQMGFSEYRAELIEQAAILHDVGKIGISDTILLKPGKFNDDEVRQMKLHCEYGQNILRAVPSNGRQNLMANQIASELAKSPVLDLAAKVAISHHEKWDGSGYPNGLSGEAIPIEGRITAVADVFDALSSKRPYKDPMPINKCLELLEEGRAKHFDPNVLDAFLSRKEAILDVVRTLSDD